MKHVQRDTRWFVLITLALATACDSPESTDEPEVVCDGAKCDAPDDDAMTCGTDEDHIAFAREVYAQLDLGTREFAGETSVVRLGDINGDGRRDLAVAPGISYAGENAEVAILASDASGCPRTYVGSVIGFDVVAQTSSHAGWSDVRSLYIEGCTNLDSVYAFDPDFEEYQVVSRSLGNECGNLGCRAPEDLPELAREQLSALDPRFYDGASFADGVSQETMGDLNGDGTEDLVVSPGLSYTLDNREQVIYLSGEPDACVDNFAGRFAASSVLAADDGENEGVRDVLAINRSACTAETTRYRFVGGEYVAGESTTTDTCDE